MPIVSSSFAGDIPWRSRDKMDGEMIYHLTKLAVLEYLTSGITSIFDMYLTPETTAILCPLAAGTDTVRIAAVTDIQDLSILHP